MIPLANDMQAQMKPNRNGNLTMYADEGAASVTPGEAMLLYGMVRALRPVTVFEIGAAYGYSTLHLATACRDNGLGRVYSTEPHDWRRTVAREWVNRAGLADWADVEREYTQLDHMINLAFIDAVHTAEAVAKYLLFLAPRLAVNATIVAHDACWAEHVEQALARVGLQSWPCVTLCNTSQKGMAIIGVRS